MYGIFTYIWLIFMIYVGKYTIHGSYGKYTWIPCFSQEIQVRMSCTFQGACGSFVVLNDS